MAVVTLYNCGIVVNAIDLSGKARKAKVVFGQEKKEKSAFGDVARNSATGMKTDNAEVEFYIDRAAGSSLQTLRALVVGPGTTSGVFTLAIRASNTAATTSNEVYSMSAIIDGDVPAINAQLGEVETIPVKFCPATGTGWSIATTS